MSNKLLIEHHLEFLSLKRGCAGLSESTLVKMPHCWKSHVIITSYFDRKCRYTEGISTTGLIERYAFVLYLFKVMLYVKVNTFSVMSRHILEFNQY